MHFNVNMKIDINLYKQNSKIGYLQSTYIQKNVHCINFVDDFLVLRLNEKL